MLFTEIITNILFKFIYWYLYLYNYLETLLFKVSSIEKYENNKMHSIYINFIIIKIIRYIENIKYFGHITTFIIKLIININYDKYNLVQVKIKQNNVYKQIIIENSNMNEIIYKINNICDNMNDNIMNNKYIITEINLLNDINNSIPLKKILDLYLDKNRLFEQKIKYILTFNNILYNSSNFIIIKYFKHLKKEQKIYKLMNILDWHIYDIYNLKEINN